MKNYRLGLYEKALPMELNIREKLEITQKSGFDWLELSIDESSEKLMRLHWSNSERAEARRAVFETGVPISTICLSGHRKFPFGSHDEETRKRSLEIMERALDLASDLGVRVIQLAGYDVYYEESDRDTVLLFRENLAKAADMAARAGVCLGFETMETPFMDTVKKGMYYVKDINSPYLGMYPDIGNLQNAACIYGGEVAEDIRTGTGHIFAAHLKETVPGIYRDMRFGSGHTDYEKALNELSRQGVRMFTGEFWYHGEPDWREELSRSSAFLRQKIKAAEEKIL